MKKNIQTKPKPQKLTSNDFFSEEISANQVVDFLERNSHFFDDYRDLANRLYISHEVQGAEAYSILQWQNKNLNNEIDALKQERDSLFQAFQNNCHITQQFNDLIKKILKAKKLSLIEYQIKSTLKQNFGYLVSKIYLTSLDFIDAKQNKTAQTKEIKVLKGYLNGNVIYLGAMAAEDIKLLNLKKEVNSFVLTKLENNLGYFLIAHPKIQFNKDKKNTALIEILNSVISFKIKQLQSELSNSD